MVYFKQIFYKIDGLDSHKTTVFLAEVWFVFTIAMGKSVEYQK